MSMYFTSSTNGAAISRAQKSSKSSLHAKPSSPVFVIVVVCCLFVCLVFLARYTLSARGIFFSWQRKKGEREGERT